MASWSRKRQLVYLVIVTVILVGAIVVPAFLVLYKAPTCFDGKKNGSEQGTDCGGACQKLCASAFLPPSVAWTRFEEVAPGLYNVAAYIVNPNSEGEARNVPYHVMIYDGRGVLITEYNSVVTIPPHRNTIAFKSTVDVAKRIPAKALFEFTAMPDWNKKADTLSRLVIDNKNYTEDTAGSSLAVTMRNTGVQPMENITVYAALYDANGNALGFSRTIVDEISPGGSAIAPFTWPIDRKGKVVSIEVLPVAE